MSMDKPTPRKCIINDSQSIGAFLSEQSQAWRPQTIRKCKSTLDRFVLFLELNRIEFGLLEPKHIREFFSEFEEKKCCKATLAQYRRHVRLYLQWSYQHRSDAETAIERLFEDNENAELEGTALSNAATPISRVLNPLPPEIDRRIQDHLLRSSEPTHVALLLIRRTGLTLSEVLRIRRESLSCDGMGRYFLSVASGKSNLNARRIEIDQETYHWITSRNLIVGTDVQYRHLQNTLTQICRDRDIPLSVTLKSLRDTFDYVRIGPRAVRELYKCAESPSFDTNSRKAA